VRLTLRGLLSVDGSLLAHGGEDDDVWKALTRFSCGCGTGIRLTGVLALLGEKLVNLVANLAVGDLNIVLGVAGVGHEGEEAVVSDVELVSTSAAGSHPDYGIMVQTSWYSWRRTLGTSMLWVDGDRSSSFLPVNKSMATKWTLAWPCLPVLEVLISTILHGRFLMTTKPFLRRAEHCMG
jgi:hypothetical protein